MIRVGNGWLLSITSTSSAYSRMVASVFKRLFDHTLLLGRRALAAIATEYTRRTARRDAILPIEHLLSLLNVIIIINVVSHRYARLLVGATRLVMPNARE